MSCGMESGDLFLDPVATLAILAPKLDASQKANLVDDEGNQKGSHLLKDELYQHNSFEK